MRLQRPPRLALFIARLLGAEDEPLVGDLLEEHGNKSGLWMWRQVLFAVVTRALPSQRRSFSLVEIQIGLTSLGILAALAFEVVVAATLIDQLVAPTREAWDPLRPQWPALLIVMSALAAFSLARLHARHDHSARRRWLD